LKNSEKEKSMIEEQKHSVKLSNVSFDLESQVMVKENKFGKMMVHNVRSK